ncbi:hypothetical protein JCM3765_003058 [Sporobolomyces pararoseus]
MHGVKRTRLPVIPDSVEVERKKKDKQLELIKQYTTLVQDLEQKMQQENYSEETLGLTTKVLSLNPEFHTGWSMRRTILLKGPLSSSSSSDSEAATATAESRRQKVLQGDLDLTNQSLKLNPKNYSVWEHRKWVLETMPDADWGFEIKMVELYLEKDGRNFHSWDYRRYLIDSILKLSNNPERLDLRTKPLPNPLPTTETELNFTKKKISENFSNFSAWHYRTKLLSKLWEERGWKTEQHEERMKRVDQEFDLVKQAIWSDPNDQSAWLYHRWLVGTGTISLVKREIQGIEELLEEEPDSRWCIDSLIHYKRLLVKLLESGEEEESRQEKEKLNLECKGMLDRLVEIDPMRANRYKDIETGKLSTVALWLVAPQHSQTESNLSNLINELSEEFSTPKFHPHVTLLTKLPLSNSLVSQVSKTLSTWKKEQEQVPPFEQQLELEFENLGTKAKDFNYFQYLFIEIKLDSKLASLRKLVREELLLESSSTKNAVEDDDYFPHLSLMYGTDSERRIAKEIIETLEKKTDGGETESKLAEEGGGGGRRKYFVKGLDRFRVGEVWCVRCEGAVEDWEVLGKIPL